MKKFKYIKSVLITLLVLIIVVGGGYTAFKVMTPKVGASVQTKIEAHPQKSDQKEQSSGASTDKTSSQIKAQTEIEQAEKVSIRDPRYKSVDQFIKEMHRGNGGLNEVVCYGKIDDLDWKAVDRLAVTTIVYVDYFKPHLKGTLRDDLSNAKATAEAVINDEYNGQGTSNVKMLHRYFHDLDIADNHFKDYDRIWGVTETLGGG